MKIEQDEAKFPSIERKRTLTSKGKKLRLKRKKKRSSSNSNAKLFDLPPIVLALLGISFLLYAYGFIHSVALLPSSDGAMDKVGRLAEIIEAMEGKRKSPVISDKHVSTPARKIVSETLKQVKKNYKETKKSTEIDLPKANWPVSIRNEDSNFEEIIHPGDKKTIMSVPKFWSPPLTDGSLMSRDLATRFGSYVDGHVDTDYRHKGNPNDRTIFVAIASYRDWQCR